MPPLPSPGSSSWEAPERTAWLVLAAVLAAGAVARFLDLGYGLPHSFHPDEGIIVGRAVRFHTGDFDPRFFNWPSLYMYVLWAVYGVLFGLRGVVESYSVDSEAFYLVGRGLTAAMGTATIAVLFALARRLYGAPVALLASVFLSVDLLHVRDSRYVTTDVPLTFLATLALLFAVRYWQEGERRDALASGLFVGLAASMKYPGVLMVLPFLVAHLARVLASPSPRVPGLLGPPVQAAAAASVAGFVLGTPYAVLTPRAFLAGVLSEVREVGSVQFGNEADLPAYLFHALHSLPEAMGLPVLLLAVGGLALAGRAALRPGGVRERVLLAFPVPYFVVIGAWESRFERYAIPLLPFLAVLAGVCLVVLARRARPLAARLAPAWRPGVGLVAVTCLLLAPEVARVARFHVLLSREDTRALALRWIEVTVPPGARLAVEPYVPALRMSAAARRELGLGGPAAGGTGEADGYWVSRLASYDLEDLRRGGVEYVVLSSFMYQRYLRACPRFPRQCRFYEDLERRAALLFEVAPTGAPVPLWVGDIYTPLTRLFERTRPGPTIRVYRLRPPEGA